jgi:aminoglycoside phosphotransferase (APT) family kinase protein
VVSACDAISIESVEPMRGGSSLAMHRLRVVARGGMIRGLVMRQYVLPEQVLDDPDIARHEAGVLQLVASMPTPTPELVACDPDGALAGAPAVLMTELEGCPQWNGRTAWMRQLAELLVEIHAVDAARATPPIRAFTTYQQASYEVPRWATRPAVWERAIEVFHGPAPDNDQVFIHRDFYPGNVLWDRRHVTGVVDWEAASIGSRSIDVAHCRINLLNDDRSRAESFRHGWEAVSGQVFDPWADIVTVIGLLDGYRKNRPAERARYDIEEMLDRALTEIGA